MAIGKHYILNNQETDRSGGNMVCDETTLMELYAPPFAAMADKVAGYMCSYNRVNGVYACESEATLKTTLKGYFNFSGFVVSDWGATHSTAAAINAGLDIDMPNNQFFSQELIQAQLAAGNVTEAQLRGSCQRIMSGWYKIPAAKRFPCDGGICINNNVSTPANKQLARKLAAMSTVLVQNEGGLLPLAKAGKLSGGRLTIALIGSDAAAPYTAGQGSGGVHNSNVAVSPLEAFQRLATDGSHGKIVVVFAQGNSTVAAAKAAAAADVAIVFGSAHSGEGHDRTDLLFAPPSVTGDATIEQLIVAVGKVQPKTVVVAAVPGQILTDWRSSVAAILVPFLPGEQYGNAIVDIIFGDVIPQAKLPLSFPKAREPCIFLSS
jgi:beta-glucosidase